MIALLLDHLWQSSLCVAGACLLAWSLRGNRAAVRFWLWFAASAKFLVPFALLTAAGAYFPSPLPAPFVPPRMALMEPLAKPFSAVTPAKAATMTPPSSAPAILLTTANASATSAPAAVLTTAKTAPAVVHAYLESAGLAIWLAGFLIIALRWLVRWSRLRALLRDAAPLKIDAPIAVKFSRSRLEPGLVGILRPVILLPQGIEQQLSQVELKAVLAHELSHWRRRDNLLAAIHMLVEALFWFFPLVWWLGARLNSERERACDESVLAEGNDPHLYAEGILKVCRAYLQSPLVCVAGISGAGLKQRIEAIMENRLIPRLDATRKLLLGVSAMLVLVPPLMLGLAAAPVAQIQARAAGAMIVQKIASAATETSLNRNPPHQETTSPLPRLIQTAPQPEILAPPSPDLSQLSHETLATPMVPASHDPRMANGQTAAAVADNAPRFAAAAAVTSGVASDPPVAPNEPPVVWHCRNPNIYGRVISPAAIQLQGFNCFLGTIGAGISTVGPGSPYNIRVGACPDASTYPGASNRQCKFDVTMSVQLADPADADKMQSGKLVRLGGDFRVARKAGIDYVSATNAKVIWTDPFDRPAPKPASAWPGLAVQEHAQTATAMLCLLEHVGDRCKYNFGGDARREARTWLYWSPNRQFDLGTLVSATYAGTQPQNAYTTNALGANAADVYYVKYRHQDMTFYIVPPDAEGNILYMLVRGGTPADAKTQPTGLSRIR